MKLYLVQAELYKNCETFFRAKCFIANSEYDAIKLGCVEFGSFEEHTWAEEVCFEDVTVKLEDKHESL